MGRSGRMRQQSFRPGSWATDGLASPSRDEARPLQPARTGARPLPFALEQCWAREVRYLMLVQS